MPPDDSAAEEPTTEDQAAEEPSPSSSVGSLATALAGAILESVERLHDVADTASLWSQVATEATGLIPSEGAAVITSRKGVWQMLGDHATAAPELSEAAAASLAEAIECGWLEFTGCFADPTASDTARSLLVVSLGWPARRDPLRLVWMGSGSAALGAHLKAAETFGRHASLAIRAVVSRDTLGQAVDAKHRVGVAQGILMNRYHLTTTQAFALLHRLSLDSNVKLRTLAQSVIDTGELPADRTPTR